MDLLQGLRDLQEYVDHTWRAHVLDFKPMDYHDTLHKIHTLTDCYEHVLRLFNLLVQYRLMFSEIPYLTHTHTQFHLSFIWKYFSIYLQKKQTLF